MIERVFDPDACTACDQSGVCPKCNGDGESDESPLYPCSSCAGDGKCMTCEGEGTMRPYG